MDVIADFFAPCVAVTYSIAAIAYAFGTVTWEAAAPHVRSLRRRAGIAFHTVYHKARLLGILGSAYLRVTAKKFVDTYVPSRSIDPPEWKLRRALVFRDRHDDVQDITSWFVPDEDWKNDIEETFLDWDDWRLELRCVYGAKKCRIVLRADDELTWPPATIPASGPHIHAMRAPDGVLSATLVPKPGIGAKSMDVTARVHKYAGFGNDYHGTCVRVRDLFPMDDHDDNVERFIGVRIIDLKGEAGLSVKTYSYDANDRISPDPKIKQA
jgi:hypothetical protein